MELNLPDMDLPKLDVVQTQPEQPVVYAVDATKCNDLKEMGILMNALGIAMTQEYAEENGLMHLLKIEE